MEFFNIPAADREFFAMRKIFFEEEGDKCTQEDYRES